MSKRGERRKRRQKTQKTSKIALSKTISNRRSPYIRNIIEQHRRSGWPYGNIGLSIAFALVSWLAHSGNERGIALLMGISAIFSLAHAAAYLKRPFKFNGDCPKCGANDIEPIRTETTLIFIRHSHSFDKKRKEIMRCAVCAAEWEVSFPVRINIQHPTEQG